MVSGCNIQISLCCNMASLCLWITDCNRRPVLRGWKWLQVLPFTEGRFRILMHNSWVTVSAAFCFMESLSTMGRKHFIKSGWAWVFPVVPSKDVVGKRHREGWDGSWFSSSHWSAVSQRPLKEGGVLWWQGLIHQASGEDCRSVTSLSDILLRLINEIPAFGNG